MSDAVTMRSRIRLESIDVLRGMVMVLMALDHVRDYFGASVDPTDPATTTVALFFTRWITHFCAPTFFLLTGTGAYLSLQKKTTRELSWFLFSRGLWLIVLDAVVLRCLGWQFNFDYHVTILNVLWGLGWAMIGLSALVWLPTWAVTTFGLVLIATHNLFDSVDAASLGALAPLWMVLHAPGIVYADPQHIVLAAYVLIPWVGVTAAGYGLGQIFRWDAPRRKRFLLNVGLGLIAAFLVLRAINGYGNPRPWATQPSSIFTALSFLNTSKYPPSLLYLMMTLGPVLLFLRLIDSRTPWLLSPTNIIGKVPLFYFALHIVLIHLIAVVVCYVRYGEVHWMFESTTLAAFPITQPPGWALGLPWIYLIWIGVVLALYPLCRWFAGVKQRRNDTWLGYL